MFFPFFLDKWSLFLSVKSRDIIGKCSGNAIIRYSVHVDNRPAGEEHCIDLIRDLFVNLKKGMSKFSLFRQFFFQKVVIDELVILPQ